MQDQAIEILSTHRVMAISTVRPDGWPQTTIVGYANDGLLLYFLISRKSQKFANIQRDNRISVAIGHEPRDVTEIQAVYAAALAYEVTAPEESKLAWRLLVERHPNLSEFQGPDSSEAVMMAAPCDHLSVLDFAKGLGPQRILTNLPPPEGFESAPGFDTPI